MGILDFVEKVAGGFAADKTIEAVDPNAGLLEKAAAAVAGYEGVGAIKEHFAGSGAPAPAVPADGDETAAPADPADPQP